MALSGAGLRSLTAKYHILPPHNFIKLQNHLKSIFTPSSPTLRSSNFRKPSAFTHSAAKNDVAGSGVDAANPNLFTQQNHNPLSGLEEAIVGYIFGKKKATEVAHEVWKNVVRKGDTVVDATCGNGYDTLALLKLVSDDTRKGRVFAMDLQKDAIESTSSLLEQSAEAHERELVEIYSMCHTKMEEIIPQGDVVRLVAFNLGYLPGGDKKVKTEPGTTLIALRGAERIVARGGLISIIAYVGHSGGREEFETVESFASGLPAESWVCCKLQMLNRPSAPVLVLLSRKHKR